MTELKLRGQYVTAGDGRAVTIKEKGGNYYMGTFDGTDSYEFWHEDGTHADDRRLNLVPREVEAAPPPAMPSARFRIAWMVVCALVGLLVGAVVFYFANRPPH